MRFCFLLAFEAAADVPRLRLVLGGMALALRVSAVDSSLMAVAVVSGISS